MPMTEDLADFYDDEEFAHAAAWTPAAGGGPYTVRVIFDNAYFETSGGMIGDATMQPVGRAPSVDLAQGPGAKIGDQIVIGGVNYRIKKLRPTAIGETHMDFAKQ